MKRSVTQSKQRVLMMISGAFAIFFTGFPHVWSVYQPYVMDQARWTQGQASMCFYLYFIAFVFGNILGGRLQDSYNPKIVVTAGGGIFAAGILLSAFLIRPTPIPMYVTYGLLQGVGQGMIYITILSTSQKWFPDRIGFASGIIVTANGLCGLIMAPVSRLLLETVGIKITFLIVGILITIAWILSSLFFTVPALPSNAEGNRKSADPAARQFTTGEMVHTKAFYYLLLSMMFGLLSYFLVSPVSQTHQLKLGIPAGIAVGSVMLGSVSNAGTRLLLPTIADKLGRSSCVKAVLLVSMAAMLVLSVSKSFSVTVAVILIYGCYGGIMGSYPAFTSSVFGMRNSGQNYGFVMLGMAAASFIAPGITKLVLDAGYTMQNVFGIGVVSAAAAFLCLMLLDRELKRVNKTRGARMES